MNSPTELAVYVNRVEAAQPLTATDVIRAVKAAAEAESVPSGEISVTFLDTGAMSALNEAHLQQDEPTDVIAFNLGELAAPLGDVYICPEVARESAAEYGVSPREELLRLIVHGVLHVLGHDHPDGPERMNSEMFRRQEAILSQLA